MRNPLAWGDVIFREESEEHEIGVFIGKGNSGGICRLEIVHSTRAMHERGG
jgi:hypothetical protein